MNVPRLLVRPDRPIGHLSDGRPVYPQAGAAGPEISVEPDDAGGGADDDEGDDDAAGKYTPPSRAEWLRTQNALVKANGSAKTRREALAEANKRIADLEAAQARREAEDERRALVAAVTPASSAADDDGGRKGKKGGRGGVAPTPAAPAPAPLPDSVLTKAQVRQMVAEATKEAKQLAAEEMHGKLANRAAREALVGEGVSKTGVAKLVKLVDLDEIEFDDDGEVTSGLDDQIEELKADFPELFKAAAPEKKTARRAPVTRASAAGRQDAAPEFKSTAERMAAQIMGR